MSFVISQESGFPSPSKQRPGKLIDEIAGVFPTQFPFSHMTPKGEALDSSFINVKIRKLYRSRDSLYQ